jgi:Flp pilus assembly protein TadG
MLLKAFRHDASGASAIEFAIVAPLFFTLLFGIVVYGYYFASMGMVNHLAYEAARASIAGLTDEERSSLAHAKADALMASLNGFLDAGAVEVDAGPSSSGTYAVTVRYHFDMRRLVGATLILPLPPADQTARVEVSHGGY